MGQRKTVKLGVMGGTFNPIHYGHLVTAEEARERFQLDEVVFMPTGQPWHKGEDGQIPAEERFIMTVIATAENPHFSVSRLEVDRAGPTYTIDTLAALRDVYGERAELFFITGADAVLEILSWRDRSRLAQYCSFIAATRPGYDLSAIRHLATEAQELPAIEVLEVTALAISSTDLRRRVKTGMPIRYLLPDAVANYIKKSGFYS